MEINSTIIPFNTQFNIDEPLNEGNYACIAHNQTRKRPEPNILEVNKIRKKRSNGEKYTSKKYQTIDGLKIQVIKEIGERKMGERCSSSRCLSNYHCSQFTEEDRQEIFDSFWKNLDWK